MPVVANPQRAAQLLGPAAAAPRELMAWLDKWPLMIESISKLRDELGASQFDVAIELGKTLDLEMVIAELLAKTVFSDRV